MEEFDESRRGIRCLLHAAGSHGGEEHEEGAHTFAFASEDVVCSEGEERVRALQALAEVWLEEVEVFGDGSLNIFEVHREGVVDVECCWGKGNKG